MATHKYILIKDGGYFYCWQPRLPMPVRHERQRGRQQTFFDARDVISDAPEISIKEKVRVIEGIFLGKQYHKGDMVIKLQQAGSVLITSYVTDVEEIRELSSEILIIVPKEIYNYPFENGKPYQITAEGVEEL